jgi:DNA-binding transcriptional regulator LsrR (DeoR family)
MPRFGLKAPRHKNSPSSELQVYPASLEFAAEAPNDHLPPMEAWRQRFKALATRDKECLAVSYYLSKGFTQKDIAGILGKSESLVSRAVAGARDRGWLKYDIRGIPPEYLEVLPVFLHEPVLASQILQTFPGLQRCTIVPGPFLFQEPLSSGGSPVTSTTPAGDQLKQLVFAAAAERLKALLTQCPEQTLVVGWGRTVNRVIHYLHELRPVSDPQGSAFDSLRIFPFLGNFSLSRELSIETDSSLSREVIETVFQISIRFSANTNARLLSILLNQKIPPRPLLTIAILKISPEALECCQPVFEADQTLMDLYGKFWQPRNRSGAIWQADTLITSVGGTGLPEEGTFRALGYVLKGNSRFTSDIAGILFDPKGKPVDLEKRYLVGPRLQHLLHIAQRHRTAKDPAPGAGVLVVASGAEKVRPLTILARQNFINELITDEQTALGMLKGKWKE